MVHKKESSNWLALCGGLSRVITYESSVTIPGKDISGTSGIVAKLQFRVRAVETNECPSVRCTCIRQLDTSLSSSRSSMPTIRREFPGPTRVMKFLLAARRISTKFNESFNRKHALTRG